MRSPDYQLKITKDLIRDYMKKLEKDFRAIYDDDKHSIEWKYFHLVNIQTDLHYLNTFIEHHLIIQLMKDSDEI